MSSPYPSSSGHGRRRVSTLGSTVREERKALFQDAQGQRGKSSANSTAHEAQSIQQSLQRTQNLLKNELNRVSQVASAIDEDGKLLEDTKQTHQSLNVSGAKKALTSLQRAQQQEQRVLMASVLFFFAVVFYIMWQRILVKLPFVERILNLIILKVNELFGHSLYKGNELFGKFLHSAQELFGEAMTKIQPALDVTKDWGNLIILKANNLFGHSLYKGNEMFGKFLHSAQELFEGAMTQIQPGLDATKEWGERTWYMAEEKGKEIYQKIQDMMPEKE